MNTPIPTARQVWNIHEPSAQALLARAQAKLAALGPIGPEQVVRGGDARFASMVQHEVDRGVAVVPIRGPLMRDPDWWDVYALGAVSTPSIEKAIRAAAADPQAHAILLHVDSPGGESVAWPDVADAVQEVRGKKPVFALADPMMASAAYAIGSQTERIFTTASSDVGSIGTLILLYDFSELFKKEGVTANVIATSPLKGTGAFGAPLSDEQRAYLQQIVDDTNQNFLQAVQRGRGMQREALLKVADGRVYVGQRALDAGLADEIANYAAVIAKIGKASGSSGRKSVSLSGGSAMADNPNPTPSADEIRKQAIEAERKRAADLNAAFPQDAEFANKANAAGWDVKTAKAEYADVLQARLAESNKQLAETKAAAAVAAKPSAAEPTAKPVGNKPLGNGAKPAAAEADEAPSAGNARSEWSRIITKRQKDTGCSRAQAASWAAREYTELRQRVIDEANSGRSAG